MSETELLFGTDKEVAQPRRKDMFLLKLLLDANREANGWLTFLDAFRHHLNLHSCHIYIGNMQTMTPRFQEFSGPAPSDWALRDYMENYFQYDHTHLAALRGEPYQWFASNLMPNYDEVHRSPAILEWAYPNGIHYMAGATLFRDGEWSCVFVHNRGEQHGPYTEDEIERFRALSPYIDSAMRLRLALSSGQGDQLRFRALLNQMRIPSAVVNEFGERIAQNALMDAFLKDHEASLAIEGEHFRFREDTSERALQMSLTESIAHAKGRGLSYSSEPIQVAPSKGGLTFALGTEALSETHEESGHRFVGALVYAVSPQNLPGVSETLLRKLYRLTAAEARVCHLFSSSLCLKEIARKEKKSVNTVREQLQRAYEKTGTRTQLQLLNLLASLPAAEA